MNQILALLEQDPSYCERFLKYASSRTECPFTVYTFQTVTDLQRFRETLGEAGLPGSPDRTVYEVQPGEPLPILRLRLLRELIARNELMQNLLPGLILIDFVWCIRTSTGECLLLTQRRLRKLDTGMHRELLELFFLGCLRITQQQVDVVLVCETLQLRPGLKGIDGKRTLRPRRCIL